MAENSRKKETTDEVKEFVVDYYISGIPEGLIAIYTGLEVLQVISILKNMGLYEKQKRIS